MHGIQMILQSGFIEFYISALSKHCKQSTLVIYFGVYALVTLKCKKQIECLYL